MVSEINLKKTLNSGSVLLNSKPEFIIIITGTTATKHIKAMRPIWIGPDLPHNKK